MAIACQGAQTGPVTVQVTTQDTNALQIDPSGLQYSDQCFALLACRANLTGNAPMAVSQAWLYREPVQIERGFYVYTINAQGDTFDLSLSFEYQL